MAAKITACRQPVASPAMAVVRPQPAAQPAPFKAPLSAAALRPASFGRSLAARGHKAARAQGARIVVVRADKTVVIGLAAGEGAMWGGDAGGGARNAPAGGAGGGAPPDVGRPPPQPAPPPPATRRLWLRQVHLHAPVRAGAIAAGGLLEAALRARARTHRAASSRAVVVARLTRCPPPLPPPPPCSVTGIFGGTPKPPADGNPDSNTLISDMTTVGACCVCGGVCVRGACAARRRTLPLLPAPPSPRASPAHPVIAHQSPTPHPPRSSAWTTTTASTATGARRRASPLWPPRPRTLSSCTSRCVCGGG